MIDFIDFTLAGFFAIIFALGCLVFFSSLNKTDSFISVVLGMMAILIGGVVTTLLLNSFVVNGKPIKISGLKPFIELRLEKRFDSSLSLVKENNGNDWRIVENIPAEVHKGDIFMIKSDGKSVVILK